MRRTAVVIACDVCITEHGGSYPTPFQLLEDGEVQTYKITYGSHAHEVDLCDEHAQRYMGALLDAASRSDEPAESFTCSCGRSFTTKRGLTRHKTIQGHK